MIVQEHATTNGIDNSTKLLLEMFSHGDREVGEPSTLQSNEPAYSLSQAELIFENLIDMQVNGELVPHLTVEYDNGLCAIRNSLMLRHMLFHQRLDIEAMGSAISLIHDAKEQSIADPLKIARSCFDITYDQRDTFNNGNVNLEITYHVAPALRVSSGDTTEFMVLDPSICDNPTTIEDWAESYSDLSKLTVIVEQSHDYKHLHVTGDSIDTCCYADEIQAASPARLVPVSNLGKFDLTFINNAGIQKHLVKASFDKLQAAVSAQKAIAAMTKGRGYHLPNCGPRSLKLLKDISDDIQQNSLSLNTSFS